jgi:hypothetical protein
MRRARAVADSSDLASAISLLTTGLARRKGQHRLGLGRPDRLPGRARPERGRPAPTAARAQRTSYTARLPGRIAAGAGRPRPQHPPRGEKAIARATAETPFAPGVAQSVDELIAAVAATAATIAAS